MDLQFGLAREAAAVTAEFIHAAEKKARTLIYPGRKRQLSLRGKDSFCRKLASALRIFVPSIPLTLSSSALSRTLV